MAEKILIESKSGSGKTTSLRHLDPEKTMVIQVVKKRLPFPEAKNWKMWDKDSQTGSIFQTTSFEGVQAVIQKMEEVGKKIIVIDDFVYLFASRVMADVDTKGYEKWSFLGKAYYDLINTIDSIDDDMRVYILTHTDTDENGFVKMKTAGKLVDNLLTPEGQFNIVLGARRTETGAVFITNGSTVDPYKSPMEMFKDKEIPNDLKTVDDTICNFYGIED